MPVKNAVNKTYKIGFVLDSSLNLSDGVQQYVLRLGEWLSTQGHSVHYIVGESSDIVPNVHSLAKNINVSFNGNKINIPLFAKTKDIRNLLAREKFDVLHVQSPYHPFLAHKVITNCSPTTAVISTFHILPYSNVARAANKLLGVILKKSLKRIDTSFAVSSAAGTFETETFGLSSNVMPNVFDYQLFSTAEPVTKDTELTVLFLGRLVERKGCQYLLEAVSKIDRASVPAFKVRIGGKGALLQKLKAYTTEVGIDDIVQFEGFIAEEDKPSFYSQADISVFPSVSGESFGIVLLEAMASGKSAVLAGNNPGYATVMAPQPDLLFDPKNTDDLADKITRLLQSDKSRQVYAAWAKQYAKSFDVNTVGPKIISEYEIAIAKRLKTQHNE